MARNLIALAIIIFICASHSAISQPLWSETKLRSDCLSTWPDSDREFIDSCVKTTKEYFTGSVDAFLTKFDKNQSPVSEIIATCLKGREGENARHTSGCLSRSFDAIYPFMDVKTKRFDWGDRIERDLTPDEASSVQAAVSDALKDPDSARFRLSRYNGSAVYCGHVNAKNSYGGYVGYSRFAIAVVQHSPMRYGRVVLDNTATDACRLLGY